MEIPVTIVKEIYPKKGFVFYLPWILVIIAVGATAYFINSIRKKS
jgi:hypothetical protein